MPMEGQATLGSKLNLKNIPVVDNDGNVLNNKKSEDILIKKIKFNDTTHSNANVHALKLSTGSGNRWVEAFSISPFSGDTNKVDPETIKVVATSTDPGAAAYSGNVSGGESISRNIIGNNTLISASDTGEYLLYYTDSISITAKGKLGYNDPTIITDGLSNITSDIDLNDYIIPGSVIDVASPVITGYPAINTYTQDADSAMTVRNDNPFSVVLYYLPIRYY